MPKHSLALCTSLIVSLTDYEELPDDSSISFLSVAGAPFFSLAFSQGHDSISQRGNVHGGDCSFNHCTDVARASHRHVKISGLQKSNQGVFYKL